MHKKQHTPMKDDLTILRRYEFQSNSGFKYITKYILPLPLNLPGLSLILNTNNNIIRKEEHFISKVLS